MKHLIEYINEATKSGIGAFDFMGAGVHTVIDNIIQQLRANGFKEVIGQKVGVYEYKVIHDGSCLTVGLKGIRRGDTKPHTHKVFIRQDIDGKLSIITKHYDPDGTGTWFTQWNWNDGKFDIEPIKLIDLPKRGNIDDTAEMALHIIKKIISRTNRFGK